MRAIIRKSIVLLLVSGSLAACDGWPTEQPPAPTITLSTRTKTVAAGTPVQVTATVTEVGGKPSTRAVTWESSDRTIATVNGSGLVTAVESGPVTITARVGGSSTNIELTAMRAPNPGGPTSTFLAFTSTAGDWVGQGQTARHGVGPGTGNWSATTFNGGRELRVRYTADGSWWHLEFAAPEGQRLKVGTYENATGSPLQAPTSPGLSFSGAARGCSRVTGRFVIHDIAVNHHGGVHRLHATFRQHCEGGASYLDGEVAIL